MKLFKGRVLLAFHEPLESASLVRYLGRLGFYCLFASSVMEARHVLSTRDIDVVLSKFTLTGRDFHNLKGLVVGGKASLFYAFAMGSSRWWIPRVLRGRECWGEPALRPREFAGALRQLAREIPASAPPATEPSGDFDPDVKQLKANRPKRLRARDNVLLEEEVCAG